MHTDAYVDQKSILDPLDLELQIVVSCLMWVNLSSLQEQVVLSVEPPYSSLIEFFIFKEYLSF